MTNKEKLGQALLGMSTKQLAKLIHGGTLSSQIEGIMCKDCEQKNGGCPAGEDADCILDLDEWLAQEYDGSWTLKEGKDGADL